MTNVVVVVVEDDPDLQTLIQTIFSMDSRFDVARVAESAEEALEAARMTVPEIIVLDHGLTGQMTGLEAARHFKDLAPQAKIILFTAHAEIEAQSEHEPAVDSFLLKTEPGRLLPLAQRMTAMMGFV